jgi:hypothetical protein
VQMLEEEKTKDEEGRENGGKNRDLSKSCK